MGEKNTERAIMEKSQRESTENNEECVKHDDEPKINYRGWKVMPFIIGKKWKFSSSVCLSHCLIIFVLELKGMKLSRSWGLLAH